VVGGWGRGGGGVRGGVYGFVTYPSIIVTQMLHV